MIEIEKIIRAGLGQGLEVRRSVFDLLNELKCLSEN